MEQKNNLEAGSEEQVADYDLDKETIRECDPSLLLPHAMKLTSEQGRAKSKKAEAAHSEEPEEAGSTETEENVTNLSGMAEQQVVPPMVEGSSRFSRFPLKYRVFAVSCALICLYAGAAIVQESGRATASSHEEVIAPQALLEQPTGMILQNTSTASIAPPDAMSSMSSARAIQTQAAGVPVAVAVKPQEIVKPVEEVKTIKKPVARKAVVNKAKTMKTVKVAAPTEDADTLLAALQKAREAK